MDVNLAAFLDDFRAEMAEYLQTLNTQLLTWERTPLDLTPIREMFLAAHTLKGAAAMMEIRDIAELTHTFEDVLGLFRSEQCQLDGRTADLLFQTLDLLQDLVERAVPSSTGLDPVVGALIDALRGQATVLGQAAAEAGSLQKSLNPSPRLLLVEHSSTVRMLEQMILTDAGFEVDAVADGNEALALARQRHYDLVVTARETQGLQGLDLAAALRDMPQWYAVPIILVSSDAHPERQQRATELGVQMYTRKRSLGDSELGEMAHSLLASQGVQR